MSGVEEALHLLAMAGKDLLALKNMTDEEAFVDEIFGFHAQQAVEKSLKAWITALGKEHTYKHDLRQLLIRLKELGMDVADLWSFIDLNDFAVQFRYEEYEYADVPLDRQAMINKVQALYDRVKKFIEEIEERG